MGVDPILRTIAATVHGRYLVRRPPGPGPHPLLVGFHGYGENAERHLAELERIPGAEGWLLCAVQGLHRFYNSRTNEVIASWMTREDRELAIADNGAYVAAAVAQVRREFCAGEVLVYAGFSQGVAMAYRAAALAGHASQGLIALGGDVPPELADMEWNHPPAVLIGRGRAEEWYTAEKLAGDVAALKHQGVEPQVVEYEGGHEWTQAFRAAAGEFMAAILQGSKTI